MATLPDDSGFLSDRGYIEDRYSNLDVTKNSMTATAESPNRSTSPGCLRRADAESGFYVTYRERSATGTGGRCPLDSTSPPVSRSSLSHASALGMGTLSANSEQPDEDCDGAKIAG